MIEDLTGTTPDRTRSMTWSEAPDMTDYDTGELTAPRHCTEASQELVAAVFTSLVTLVGADRQTQAQSAE